MKWAGVVCLLASIASAEPYVYVEGGVPVGAVHGLPQHTTTSVGAALEVGARIVPHVSLFVGYRDLGVIAEQHGNPATVNNATATISYGEWSLGGWVSWPAIPHLDVFGELALLAGLTSAADSDFAGSLGYLHAGIAMRAGTVVHLGRHDRERPRFGLGVALSFRATPHQSCDNARVTTFDCVQSWSVADIFLQVAY